MSYAAAHAGSQFRVHTFTLSICDRSARFIRGIAAADCYSSFDYSDPHILAHFFGVRHLNHSQRGYEFRSRITGDLQQIRMSKNIAKEILLIVNSVLIVVPDRDVQG